MKTTPYSNFHCVAGLLLGLLASAELGAAPLAPFSVALENARPVSALHFTPASTKFLSGKGPGIPAESFDDLGIALIFSQNNHWASDLWSSKGYEVSQGTLEDPESRIAPVTAYRISPPTYSKDFQFTASGNDLYFKFPRRESHVVYSMSALSDGLAQAAGKRIFRFRNSVVTEEAVIPRSMVVVNGFTRIPEMNLHSLKEAKIFFYLPKAVSIHAEDEVAEGIRLSRISNNPIGRFSRFSIDVSRVGQPYHCYSNQRGPGATVMENNQLLCFPESDDSVSILWKDTTRKNMWITQLKSDLSHTSVRMPVCLDVFGAATRDRAGNYYYITYNNGIDPLILLVKTTMNGKLLARQILSFAPEAFDVHSMEGYGCARLHHMGGRLCLVLARIMHNGHQGSIISTFNTTNLAIVRPPQQNSSHSFDSRITDDGSRFLTMSLGDNYPRGIVVDKLDDVTRGAKVIFTYRTRHATEARDRGDGVMLEAGRWSNDNRTYTELGDCVAHSSGYGVLLASERSVSNSLTTEAINQARNLAFLPLSQNFETIAQTGYVVPNGMIAAGGVDSKPFGFYDYGGGFVSQQNRNVRWLTDYQDKDAENASRAKMIRMKDKSLLVVWEKWTESEHVSTHAMKIDALGKILQAPANLGAVRLSPGDRLAASSSRIFGVTSDGAKLELTVLE